MPLSQNTFPCDSSAINVYLTAVAGQIWLQQENNNKLVSKCMLCSKTFDISNMGEAAIKSHYKIEQS